MAFMFGENWAYERFAVGSIALLVIQQLFMGERNSLLGLAERGCE
jgi:hypothetical protein